MKTIVLEKPGRFLATETERPPAPAGRDVLVRVRRIGICGTDIHAYKGDQPFFEYPRILGHELGVEVAEAGPEARGINPGDRCAVEPYLNCGGCIPCRAGKTNCCTRLRVPGVHIDGGMREWFVVPADKLHRSEKLTTDQLALVEPLGIGFHAVGRADPAPGETVLVIGAGPIGLGVLQFALLRGCRVLVMDVSPGRLAFCREHFEATETLEGGEAALARIQETLDGELPTVVFDATGNRQSMENAFSLTASGGRLVFVGLVLGELSFNDPEFHRKELTLLASRNARSDEYPKLIAHIEKGEVNTAPWITHRAPMASLPDIFADWIRPEAGMIKGMLEV